MANGFLGSTLALVLIIVGLLSGVLSIFREVQVMYFPTRVGQKKTFWGFVRIAAIVALIIVWRNEHSKAVEEHSKVVALTEGPKVIFDKTIAIVPPEQRHGYGSPEGNWAIFVTIRPTECIQDVVLFLYSADYRTDDSEDFHEIDRPIRTPLARANIEHTFEPIDICGSQDYSVLGSTPDGEHLFLVTSGKELELQKLTDMPPGEYRLHLGVESRSLKRRTTARLTVKWTGHMSNDLDIRINEE